jgi:hypothetical protein
MIAPARKPSRRLLSVSRSTQLLIGRNDMLAIAGYAVSSPREPLDAILLLQHEDYLAVLIGHTVRADEAEAIAAKAKTLHVPAIFVDPGGNLPAPAWADLSVDNDGGISRLLNFLEKESSVGF